jgi:glutathione-specific gamma-glutamylcyclotransferase
MTLDPFARHPELRNLITDPERSNKRSLKPQAVPSPQPKQGLDEFLRPPEQREALRHATLGGFEGDLWVFGYGSLMWDPGFRFVELRRAHVADHACRFILKDIYGARGTRERPGLMAALDHGPDCDGLVFRIAAADVAVETEVLWNREMSGNAYHAVFLMAETIEGPVRALAFTADHSSPAIVGEITRAEQVEFIATGAGFFGSSLDYLKNIAAHFAAFGIVDAEVSGLMRETSAWLDRRAFKTGDAT